VSAGTVAANAKGTAYQLPSGEVLIPCSSLTKLGVDITGDALVTLRFHSIWLTVYLNTEYYQSSTPDLAPLSYPVIRIADEILVPRTVVDTLGITIQIKGNTCLLRTTKKDPVVCPLCVIEYAHARGYHPIANLDGGYLVGGVIDGKWGDATAISAHITGIQPCKIYSLDSQTVRTIPLKISDSETGGAIYISEKVQAMTVGVVAEWNPWPRFPKVLAAGRNTIYRDEVKKLLKQRSIITGDIALTQVIRVDLDGDGVDEVLLTATTSRDGYLTDGVGVRSKDFSLAVVRKVEHGKVVNHLLKCVFAPNIKHFDFIDIMPCTYTIIGVLDIDGDGKMEILLREQYAGFQRLGLYKYAQNTFLEMSSCVFSD